jgi:hypothetical protein
MAKFKNLNPVAVVVTRGDGGRLFVGGRKVVETEDPKWIRRLTIRKDFQNVEEVVEHRVGAGLKTHIRGSKVDRKPSRAEPKEEVDCPKGSYKCKGVCKCDTIKKSRPQYRKKPKGLRKSKKRAD